MKRGRIMTFLLLAFLLIACTPTEESFTDADQIDPGQVVTFPDQNLEEKCIRPRLGKTNGGPIYAQDLLVITAFGCTGYGISDIAGMEYMHNLEILTMYSNQIVSLEPLRNLKKVRELDLHDNLIEDISPLQGLTLIENLIIHQNKIKNIDALASLTNLQEMYLDLNLVESLAPLSNLKNLVFLSLSSNNITSVDSLGTITSIKTIDVERNKITDIAPIKTLLNLNRLYITDNCITDFSPIEYLKANGALTTVTGDTAEEQQNCTAADAYPVPRNL